MDMQLIAAISLLVSMGKFVIYAKIENQKSSDVAQKKPILTFKHPKPSFLTVCILWLGWLDSNFNFPVFQKHI